MECAMNGTQRRRKLLDMMRQASAPLSGGALGRATGVSRQVVVQDIALLRTMGYPILSTARGYVLNESKHASRLFKVCHTNEQTEDELVTIGCLHLPIISLELVQGGLQSCNGILVGTSTVQLFLF